MRGMDSHRGLCYHWHDLRTQGRGRPSLTTRSEPVTRPSEPAASPGMPTTPALDLPANVLDALEQGVVALDRDRKVVYANRWIEEVLGSDPGSLLGMSGAKLFPGADARC